MGAHGVLLYIHFFLFELFFLFLAQQKKTTQVNGIMTNTGHSVIFYTGSWDEENGVPGGDPESPLGGRGGISDTFLGGGGGGGGPGGVGASIGGSGIGVNGGVPGSGSSQPKTLVNITGGPLSYRYQFHEIHIHYGMRDDAGSEHTVDGYAFPAEVSLRNEFIHLQFFFCSFWENWQKNLYKWIHEQTHTHTVNSGIEEKRKNIISHNPFAPFLPWWYLIYVWSLSLFILLIHTSIFSGIPPFTW